MYKRQARKSEVVRALDLKTDAVTEFTGYDVDECAATVLEVSRQGDSLFIITAVSYTHLQKEILALAEGWRPWRGYAAVNLWNSLKQH